MRKGQYRMGVVSEMGCGQRDGHSTQKHCILCFSCNGKASVCSIIRALSIKAIMVIKRGVVNGCRGYLICEHVCIHNVHHFLICSRQISTDLLYQPLFSRHTGTTISVLKEKGRGQLIYLVGMEWKEEIATVQGL